MLDDDFEMGLPDEELAEDTALDAAADEAGDEDDTGGYQFTDWALI